MEAGPKEFNSAPDGIWSEEFARDTIVDCRFMAAARRARACCRANFLSTEFPLRAVIRSAIALRIVGNPEV